MLFIHTSLMNHLLGQLRSCMMGPTYPVVHPSVHVHTSQPTCFADILHDGLDIQMFLLPEAFTMCSMRPCSP